MRPRFGLDKVFDTRHINRILATTETLDVPTQDVVMSMAYDTDFGLCNHETGGVWSSIEVHPKEDLKKIDPFRLAVDSYLAAGIYDKTGLTLDKYLSLERSKISMLKEAMVHHNNMVKLIQENAKLEAEGKLRGGG